LLHVASGRLVSDAGLFSSTTTCPSAPRRFANSLSKYSASLRNTFWLPSPANTIAYRFTLPGVRGFRRDVSRASKSGCA
jgi:hypothetical protein